MKKTLSVILFAFIANSFSKAQLITNGTQTPAQLVQNVLLGSGVAVSNVTYIGALGPDTSAIGSFSGTTNLGISSGVVLTTGTIYSPNGPQGPNNIGSNGIDNKRPGDSLLTTLIATSTAQTFNAAILEFDFVPSADTVRFRYVFGSEEYPEYVCSNYNDIFGFFISGPNPSGGNYNKKNIALIPGTNLPVAINSVNSGSSGGFGSSGCISLAYSSLYVDNTSGVTVQYDGFTKVFTAIAPVICGQKYHIKLAIADAGDGVFDSGVFLEAGSFSSKTISLSSKITYSGNDTILLEGCGQAKVILSRGGKNLGGQDTMLITVGGTATNGVDYTPAINDTLIFLPGVDSLNILINAINDAIVEGLETLVITVEPLSNSPCLKSSKDSLTIYIKDLLLKVSPMADTKSCPGISGSTILTANAVGGGLPYAYSWSNSATTKSITVNAGTPAQYIVTITDACGAPPVIDTVNVKVLSTTTLQADAGKDTLIVCPNISTALTIKATASGGIKPYSYSWSGGLGSNPVINVAPLTTTTYTVVIKDSCGVQIAKDTMKVTIPVYLPLSLSAPKPEKVCPGKPVNLVVAASGGAGSYGYSWTTVTGSDLANNPTAATTYVTANGPDKLLIKVKDLCGVIAYDTVKVVTEKACQVIIPNVFSPNGDNENDYFVIQNLDLFPNSRLQIFDRWGLKLFDDADYKNTWTAPNVPDGTYYYILFLSNDPKGTTGFVTILRGQK